MKITVNKGTDKEKIYTAEGYELSWGVLEDLSQAIELDGLKEGSDAELVAAALRVAVKSTETVRGLIMRIFGGITAEELRTVPLSEVAAVLVDAGKYSIQLISTHIKAKN